MVRRLPLLRPPTTWQIVVAAILALLAMASLGDHLLRGRRSSASQPTADDRPRYDRRAGVVTTIVDGETLDVDLSGERVHVRLLGIDAPDAELGRRAAAYLAARAGGKPVTLRFDELSRPRDGDGRLVAYVYLGDNDLLNDAVVRDGWAFFDRREPCDFGGQFEASETGARAAKRGLWKTITVEQMPAWRRQWMSDRGLK